MCTHTHAFANTCSLLYLLLVMHSLKPKAYGHFDKSVEADSKDVSQAADCQPAIALDRSRSSNEEDVEAEVGEDNTAVIQGVVSIPDYIVKGSATRDVNIVSSGRSHTKHYQKLKQYTNKPTVTATATAATTCPSSATGASSASGSSNGSAYKVFNSIIKEDTMYRNGSGYNTSPLIDTTSNNSKSSAYISRGNSSHSDSFDYDNIYNATSPVNSRISSIIHVASVMTAENNSNWVCKYNRLYNKSYWINTRTGQLLYDNPLSSKATLSVESELGVLTPATPAIVDECPGTAMESSISQLVSIDESGIPSAPTTPTPFQHMSSNNKISCKGNVNISAYEFTFTLMHVLTQAYIYIYTAITQTYFS